MSKSSTPKAMVSTKNKHKVISCSTPEPNGDSPSRDSDSTMCDSECASPVPFLCTQDGAEGETDVVWNFYTPKSGNTSTSKDKNSTPLSRRSKKSFREKAIEKHIPKKRPVRPSQKKTQLFQELYELNQNLHELMAKKQVLPEKPESGSEEDIFKSQDCSPKCIPRFSSRCLRKNVLSSNFGKPDPDAALESDDSMNECLLKASQIVEEKILKHETDPKKTKYENLKPSFHMDPNFKLDVESMDSLINISMKYDSPIMNKLKCQSPCVNNDSFDNFFGNLNDSALAQLTQMPIKADLSKNNSIAKDWTVNELVVHDSSPLSKSFLSRHNSMPASPSLHDLNKPSTSGMAFGRFSSMPFHNDNELADPGDSPIRCTPDEIKKKHQLAREKLMAKRLLPFTTQHSQSLSSQLTQLPIHKRTQFQLKTASSTNSTNIIKNHKTGSADNSKNNLSVSSNNDSKKPQLQFQYKTSTNTTTNLSKNNVPKNSVNVSNKPPFQPKTATATSSTTNTSENNGNASTANNSLDMKQLIEKKRQEALLKLRRRQPQNK